MSKTVWVVRLTKATESGHYPAAYFPRKFAYAAEAKRLVAAVEKEGGAALREKGGS